MKQLLEETRIRAGIWEGLLTGVVGDVAPRLSAYCQNRKIADPIVSSNGEGGWVVRVAIPPDTINGGSQTFLIMDENNDVLATFLVFSGSENNERLDAEVKLLRAELDMLKRAFRRQFPG